MIGHLIKYEMDQVGMRQNFLAKKAKIHEGSLSLILNNHANPTVDTIQRIVDALGKPIMITPKGGIKCN